MQATTKQGKLILNDKDHGRKVWCYETSPKFSVYLTELEAQGRVPLHRLAGQVAILHMVEGARVVTVGAERRRVREGEVTIIPAYGTTGIESPQDEVDDGPCRFWTTYVMVDPPVELPDIGLRRIVAVRRDEGRITHLRLDDGRVLTLTQAIAETESGGIRDVHVVRPRKGRPYLRVHHSLKNVFSLDDLPRF